MRMMRREAKGRGTHSGLRGSEARGLIVRLIRVFEANSDFLASQGWVVSDARSFSWWGGLESPDEVAISSFLVQLTRWETVAEVMKRLRAQGIASIEAIAKLSVEELDRAIINVNFHRTKARRLKAFAEEAMRSGGLLGLVSPANEARLLGIEGIGIETAKSMLLFIANAPVFPPSKYSQVVLSRLIGLQLGLRDVEELVEDAVSGDVYALKIIHAGLASVGKAYCSKRSPKCGECPLRGICSFPKRRNEEPGPGIA